MGITDQNIYERTGKTMYGKILSLVGLLLFSSSTLAQDLTPNQQYSPEEVIQIVLEALRTNNEDDHGIETVFRFASPANKRHTGPLENFTQMIKRGFPEMLNFIDSETEPLQIRDGIAIQPVWLTTSSGQEVGYLFKMGKQTGGEYEGSWLTDAVLPLAPRGQSI